MFGALAGYSNTANALAFTQSNAFGTGNFGSITANCIDLACTIVDVHVDVGANTFVDTGAHRTLTLSLAGSGQISQLSLDTLNTPGLFDALAHTNPAAYANPPFGNFTDAIICTQTQGGSVGCGSTLDFTITNFSGFLAATDPFGGLQIFAAADILLATGGTGVVGAPGVLTPTPFAVPGPSAGAGIPGLIAACLGMFGLRTWRRRRQLA